MSMEERVDAFLEEIVSPIIGDSAIDDEETKLLDAMLVLFRLTAEEADPPPSWIMRKIMDNDGREKATLNAELDAAIERRMDEGDHQLTDKNIRDLEDWRSYRKKGGESKTPEPLVHLKPEAEDEVPEDDPSAEKDDEEEAQEDDPSDEKDEDQMPDEEKPQEDDEETPDEEEAQEDDPSDEENEGETSEKAEDDVPEDDPADEKDDDQMPEKKEAQEDDDQTPEEEQDEKIADLPAPPPPLPPLPSSQAALTLTSGDKSLSLNITTKLSATLVRQFGEDSQYWDEDWQMTTEKRDNEWYLVPNTSATNETLLNGQTVTSPVKLSDGDEIGAGRQSKGVIKLPLTVEMTSTT
ncbi:MAG: hypothetical protein CMI30_06055 [Opitutae bacterium]|nr:hypothetical protein [Opitutae bacterium]